MCAESLAATHQLASEGIRVNMTLIFSAPQALLIAQLLDVRILVSNIRTHWCIRLDSTKQKTRHRRVFSEAEAAEPERERVPVELELHKMVHPVT